MHEGRPKISPLFVSQFAVDAALPFERHLNRLEVEIGREDYSQLKQVELLDEIPAEQVFAGMEEITGRLLKTTQNNYNRELLKSLQVRVYLDPDRYTVYYRLPDRCLRFVPSWRRKALQRFFVEEPVATGMWAACGSALPGFECRFQADGAGGVLLLRRHDGAARRELPLITASHGPYDPHTLEVALYFLRTGKGGAAVVNLGFAGREPLADESVQKLAAWGVPLNPSNIDVIYPYVDGNGHPCCYKLEEGLPGYVSALELERPELVIDLHGCVGTHPEDQRVVVGLGGLPPFRQPGEFGAFREQDGVLHLQPDPVLRRGLTLLRELSAEIFVQFCSGRHVCCNFALLGGMQLIGVQIDPRRDVGSLLAGEERSYLPREDLRWIPGAGANALQRLAAQRLNPRAHCLHVEIPTAVRRKMVLKLHALEIEASFESSGL
jgi:hypothetical protein